MQPPGSRHVLLVDQMSCKHARGHWAAAVWVAGTDAREGKDASLSTRPAKGRSYSGLFNPGYLLFRGDLFLPSQEYARNYSL